MKWFDIKMYKLKKKILIGLRIILIMIVYEGWNIVIRRLILLVLFLILCGNFLMCRVMFDIKVVDVIY